MWKVSISLMIWVTWILECHPEPLGKTIHSCEQPTRHSGIHEPKNRGPLNFLAVPDGEPHSNLEVADCQEACHLAAPRNELHLQQ